MALLAEDLDVQQTMETSLSVTMFLSFLSDRFGDLPEKRLSPPRREAPYKK
jgi:hypothetical protein